MARLAGDLYATFLPYPCLLCEAPLIEAYPIPICIDCLGAVGPLPKGGCERCAQSFPSLESTADEGMCGRCRTIPPSYDRLFAYAAYQGEVRGAIRGLKYGRIQTLADFFGERMATTWIAREIEADWIVPTPLHWTRRLERGFNQAHLLSKPVGKATGMPVVRALTRIRSTIPQAGLSRDQRQRNLRGAFRVRHPERIRGKRIVLVDDVATTGSTFEACARVLKRAGAVEVTALAAARANAEIRG